MSQVTEPIMLDRTGERIADALENMSVKPRRRIASLTDTPLANGSIVEAIGIPTYVDNVSEYAAYGLTETGWYVFCRVWSINDIQVTGETTVEGVAGSIREIGADHIDIAIKFDVAAMSKKVVITWEPDVTETLVFKATDLAVRNLDYRSTFYVYDISGFATWSFGQKTGSFDGTTYYIFQNGSYVKAAVVARRTIPENTYYTHSYALTEDETFVEGKTYYTKEGTVYTPAEVTPGEAVTENTYYEDVYTLTTDKTFPGSVYYVRNGESFAEVAVIGGDPIPAYYEAHYTLTEDTTFQENKTYYTESGGVYSEATVSAGEEVTPDTYYEVAYSLTEDIIFQDGKTYYTESGGEYSAAVVTTGAEVPAFFTHSKLTFQGMTRNVTYKFDEIIDAPIEIILPEVLNDGYGCWFEIQTQFSGSFSVTLTPTDTDVKIGTATTQGLTAGINVLDLTYADINDIKVWTLLNTHSNLPAAT